MKEGAFPFVKNRDRARALEGFVRPQNTNERKNEKNIHQIHLRDRDVPIRCRRKHQTC